MFPEFNLKHFYAISVHSYMIPEYFYTIVNTFIRSWILLYDPEYFFLEHYSVITKQHSWWHTFFSQQNVSLWSLIVKTGDYQCMWLLKHWFKTSERPWKVHSKWNSTLNRDLLEAVFDALLRSVSYYFIVIIVIIIRRHSWYCVPLIIYCYHCCHYYCHLSFITLLL